MRTRRHKKYRGSAWKYNTCKHNKNGAAYVYLDIFFFLLGECRKVLAFRIMAQSYVWARSFLCKISLHILGGF